MGLGVRLRGGATSLKGDPAVMMGFELPQFSVEAISAMGGKPTLRTAFPYAAQDRV